MKNNNLLKKGLRGYIKLTLIMIVSILFLPQLKAQVKNSTGLIDSDLIYGGINYSKFELKKITLVPTKKRVKYKFVLDGKTRILTYNFLKNSNGNLNGNYNINIRNAENKVLAKVKVTKQNVKFESTKGTFTIANIPGIKLKKYLGPRNAFLVKQHFISKGKTISLSELKNNFNSMIKPKVASGKFNEDYIQTFDWSAEGYTIPGWAVPRGETNCTTETMTCSYENIDGSTGTVTISCNCGMPICSEMSFSIDVLVIYMDPTTGAKEEVTETRSFTKCVCSCISDSKE